MENLHHCVQRTSPVEGMVDSTLKMYILKQTNCTFAVQYLQPIALFLPPPQNGKYVSS